MSGYDDEQMALLLDFLKRSNMMTREEIARLRETQAGEGGDVSIPLGDLASGRIVVSAGMSQITLRAGAGMADLYRANFTGSMPDVKVEAGTITIRYPNRFWLAGRRQRTADITLTDAIPWQVVVRGGGSVVTAELGGLDLLELEANGTGSVFHLELPEPSGVVPVRLGGSGSEITVRRPAGVAARVHLTGWASALTFDDQVTGSGSEITITLG